MTYKASEVHSLVLGFCIPSLDLQHLNFIVKSGSFRAAGTGGVGMVHSQVWSVQQSEVQEENCLLVLVWCIVPGERHCVCNRSFNALFALNVKSVDPRRRRENLGRFLWRSRIKAKGRVVPWVYWKETTWDRSQERKSDKNKNLSRVSDIWRNCPR